MTEDESLMKPASIYGATKVLNEFYGGPSLKSDMELKLFQSGYQRFTVRPGKIGVVTAWTSKMVAAAVSGSPVQLAMRSDQLASFIYVDDSAEQLARLAKAETLGHRVYNSGGTTATPAQFAAVVEKYCPGAHIRFDPDAALWPYPHKVDGSRLEKEIGFYIRKPEQGLLKQINQERVARGMDPIEGNPSSIGV